MGSDPMPGDRGVGRQRQASHHGRDDHPAHRLVARQTTAVFETLDDLRERVWDLCGRRIQQVLREQRCTTAISAADSIDEADVSF